MSPWFERDWRLYAEGIIEARGKVRRFVAGIPYEGLAVEERARLFESRDGRVIMFRARLKQNGVDPEQRSALIHVLGTMVMEARAARSGERYWPNSRPLILSCKGARSRLCQHG